MRKPLTVIISLLLLVNLVMACTPDQTNTQQQPIKVTGEVRQPVPLPATGTPNTDVTATTSQPLPIPTKPPTQTRTPPATTTSAPPIQTTPTVVQTTSAVQPTPTSQVTISSLKPNEGLVTRVIDGDTIEVQLNGITFGVRYIGVDTPEPDSLYAADKKLATEATSINETLVAGKIVRLEKDVSDKDSFGRLLRYVYVGDLLVNAELVRLGCARAKAYPPDVKFQNIFSTLEFQAKTAKLGMWKLSLEVASVTSAIKPGADAKVTVKTIPGASCTITVTYSSGHQSTASGLVPKKADDNGVVSWTWKISTSTNPGTGKIAITVTSGSDTISQTIDFLVQ